MPAAVSWPLGLVGMEWPKGDETAMDRLNDDWEQFAHRVELIRSELNSVSAGIGHSVEGDMQKAIDAQLDSLLSGDMSLERLIAQADDIAHCCNTMSNEIFVLKMIFVVELVALALYVTFLLATAEINWSAPIEIAQAVFEGRMTLAEAVDMVVRRILAKLLEKGLEEFAATSTKDMARLLGKDLVTGFGAKAFDGAIVEGSRKLGFTLLAQVRDNALWDKPMDPGELISKTLVSATAGAALSPIAAKADTLISKRGDSTATHLQTIIRARINTEDPSTPRRMLNIVLREGLEAGVRTGNWWGKETLPGKVTGPATTFAENVVIGPGFEQTWNQGSQPGVENPHSVAPAPTAESSGGASISDGRPTVGSPTTATAEQSAPKPPSASGGASWAVP
ncbi:hypothetical protein GORHZ_168_00170 [Gordonia rhizosphera NBRC 16068]|uniref:Outer membrane channel protein CpnT-like N-terminal domain-containing protein n=2 Tax=Gordonia rhizosphera TaxID=83341 RepID=K6VZ78_9ACTN|nr:hypothetical protein GORHZ_168_00170 [Gordonia rhizosphera NBRC 16068]